MSIDLVDNLMIVFSFIFYGLLILVYLFRAHERDNLELKLSNIFSAQLFPFTLLWLVNVLGGSGLGRIITGLPIIIYLVYDYWYRAYTKKKPVHHPDKWPRELILYLILLQIGSIMLNWYAYLISDLYGSIVVIGYFMMIFAYFYYQIQYNKKKTQLKE